ncbi:MAG: hypothetical protein HRU26_16605 [Psychroserpens sp.]|nr:hypothetical protein [Psychroserpens sp.]
MKSSKVQCNKVNLKASNCFAVDSGYYYTYNVVVGKDLSGSTLHYKVKDVNGESFLLELEGTSDASISGLYINDITVGDFDVRILGEDSVNIIGNKVFECYYVNSTGKHLLFQGNQEFDKGAIR